MKLRVGVRVLVRCACFCVAVPVCLCVQVVCVHIARQWLFFFQIQIDRYFRVCSHRRNGCLVQIQSNGTHGTEQQNTHHIQNAFVDRTEYINKTYATRIDSES